MSSKQSPMDISINLWNNHTITLRKDTQSPHSKELYDMILSVWDAHTLIPHDPSFVDDDWWNVWHHEECKTYITKKNSEIISNTSEDILETFGDMISKQLSDIPDNQQQPLIQALQQASNPLTVFTIKQTSNTIHNTSEYISELWKTGNNIHEDIRNHTNQITQYTKKYTTLAHKISKLASEKNKHKKTLTQRNNKQLAQEKLNSDDEIVNFEKDKTSYISIIKELNDLYLDIDRVTSDIKTLQESKTSPETIHIIEKKLSSLELKKEQLQDERDTIRSRLLVSPSVQHFLEKKSTHAEHIRTTKKQLAPIQNKLQYEKQKHHKHKIKIKDMKTIYAIEWLLNHIEQWKIKQSTAKKLKKHNTIDTIELDNLISLLWWYQKNTTLDESHISQQISTIRSQIKYHISYASLQRHYDTYHNLHESEHHIHQLTLALEHAHQTLNNACWDIRTDLITLTDTYNTEYALTEWAWYNRKNIPTEALKQVSANTIEMSTDDDFINNLVKARFRIFAEQKPLLETIKNLTEQKRKTENKKEEYDHYFTSITSKQKKNISVLESSVKEFVDAIKKQEHAIITTNRAIEKQLQDTTLSDFANSKVTKHDADLAQEGLNNATTAIKKATTQQKEAKDTLIWLYKIDEHINHIQTYIQKILAIRTHHNNNKTPTKHVISDFDRISTLLYSLHDMLTDFNDSLASKPYNESFLTSYKSIIEDIQKNIDIIIRSLL